MKILVTLFMVISTQCYAGGLKKFFTATGIGDFTYNLSSSERLNVACEISGTVSISDNGNTYYLITNLTDLTLSVRDQAASFHYTMFSVGIGPDNFLKTGLYCGGDEVNRVYGETVVLSCRTKERSYLTELQLDIEKGEIRSIEQYKSKGNQKYFSRCGQFISFKINKIVKY